MDKQAAYELGARLALQESDVAEKYYPHTKQAAYEMGVKLAMQQAGLVKKSFLGTLGGGLYGAAHAPEGQGGRGALGGALGAEVGGLGGALAGEGLGALVSALSKGKIPMGDAVRTGALPGALAGLIPGASAGSEWFTD